MINQKINDFNLRDLMDIAKKEVKLELNCHHLGTVQKFDAAKQTCEISIDYKKTYYKKDSDGSLIPDLVSYAILLDCPVIVMGGASGSLRFPIKKGDRALVLFNDRDIDDWFKGATDKAPPSNRLHSLSDGFALIGVRPLDSIISDYDPEAAGIFTETAKVAVKKKIKIENNSGNLKSILTDLITEISSSTVGSTGGPLLNASAIATYVSKIGGVLE